MTGRHPSIQDEDLDGYRGDTHLVRRRWAWAALALLVAGVVVLGIGLAVPLLALAVTGAGVLVVGGGLAFWSGLFWDVHTSGHPLPQDGGTRRVPGARARREAPEAEDRAARIEHRYDRIQADRASTRTNLTRAGGLLLLVAGTWLSLTQWTLYPETTEGREGTWRAMAGGIVVLLLAVRVLAAGRSRWPILVGPPVALLLVLGGLLAASTDRAAASEVTSGLFVLLGALLTLDRRRPGPGPRAPVPPPSRHTDD